MNYFIGIEFQNHRFNAKNDQLFWFHISRIDHRRNGQYFKNLNYYVNINYAEFLKFLKYKTNQSHLIKIRYGFLVYKIKIILNVKEKIKLIIYFIIIIISVSF